MKKIILALIFVMAAVSLSSASVYTFNPTPADLYDLDHYKAYEWGIDHDFSGETISGVRLTIKDINNWWPEDNALFIHLLDNVTPGVTVYDDPDATINDYFAGQGVMVGTYSDPNGGPLGDLVTVTYDFGSLGILDDFASYAADGNFGFGFDPDCHFFNDKVNLTVVTDAPEPTTFALLTLGLLGGVIVRKKFRS